jgi:hypothetical protein
MVRAMISMLSMPRDSKAPEQAADDLIGVAKSSETPVKTTIP